MWIGMGLATLALGLVLMIELPPLWGRNEARGERWAVLLVVGLGLALAVPLVLDLWMPSLWQLVEAIVGPVGRPLFRAKTG